MGASDGDGDFYEKQDNLVLLANHLRGRSGMKVRHGVEHEKRVEYFKGKRLIEFLTGEEWTNKALPKIETQADATAVCKDLLKKGFFHKSARVKDKKGVLTWVENQVWDENAYYTWIYEGPKGLSNILTVLIIVFSFLIVCFPIWPLFLKKYMWYLSVTLLIFIIGFVLLRLLVFLVVWIVGYDFWIFPRMFDESLGFCESFVPVYSVEKAAKGQGYYRLGLFGGVLAFVYWVYSQPSEFDSFIATQNQFVFDLYEGTLLTDVAQDDKENIDTPKFPSFEDLLREEEEERQRDQMVKREEEMLRKQKEEVGGMDDSEVDAMLEKLMQDSEDNDEDNDEDEDEEDEDEEGEE